MAAAPKGVRPVAHAAEGWKRGGVMKVEGIPAPTGPLEVGCVDVMHRFAGEDRGLLVRLFYPSEPGLAGTHHYAQWAPSQRYVKGYLDFLQLRMSLVIATLVRLLTSPKSPCLWATPLLKVGSTQSDSVQPHPSTQSQSSSVNPNPVSAPDQSQGESELNTGSGDGPPAAAAAAADSPLTPGEKFPVVVFSHGMGGMRTTYTGICCDLVSHGYVVAAVEHRDRSACTSLDRVPLGTAQDGREQYRDVWYPFYLLPKEEPEFPFRHEQVKQRSCDVRRALDLLSLLNEGGSDVHNMMGGDYDLGQFKGRLKVGGGAVIMGHSFGGATTIQTLSEDDRFKCGIALDSWMLPVHRDLYKVGVSQPLLFINSGSWQWAENIRCMMELAQTPGSDGISQCHVLTLPGTEHKSQSDSNFVTPDSFRREPLPPLDRNVAHAVNMDLCHAFLKRFFWEDPTYRQHTVPNLDGGEGASEHIIFGSNVNWQKGSSEDTGTGETAETKGAEGIPIEGGETLVDHGQPNSVPSSTSVEKTSSEGQPNSVPSSASVEKTSSKGKSNGHASDLEERGEKESLPMTPKLASEGKESEEV